LHWPAWRTPHSHGDSLLFLCRRNNSRNPNAFFTFAEFSAGLTANPFVSRGNRNRLLGVYNLSGTPIPYNFDYWDGYRSAREEWYGVLGQSNRNPVIVSGGSHNGWAFNLQRLNKNDPTKDDPTQKVRRMRGCVGLLAWEAP
jgi:phosphodiesterase/alkaline phosphatase D-like protein